MRRACLIVGKAPTPGLTKTRLVPPLSPADAADVYRAFLLDSVSLGLKLGWERVSVVHPAGSGQALASLMPATVCLLEQPGRGIGDALSYAFEKHLAEGFLKVVLIGSDTPTLPVRLIEQASAALDTHDLTIGPSADGGYYLIGLRKPNLRLFENIDWSTSRVYRQTLEQARRLNLSVQAVPAWYDVDELADLERLQRELASAPDSVAPNTRAALRRLSGVLQP